MRMIFTPDQIKEAHAKVKSHTKYTGENDYTIQSGVKYPVRQVDAKSDSEQFSHYLKNHQQGQTDYPTFCRHSAETGVEKWTADLKEMTCTYYDKAGNKMLVENIPQPSACNNQFLFNSASVTGNVAVKTQP